MMSSDYIKLFGKYGERLHLVIGTNCFTKLVNQIANFFTYA